MENHVIVGATLALAVIAIWQAIISRQTMRRSLRAYVGIDSETPLLERHNLQFEIKNFGQTPAYDVTHWLCFGLTLGEPPPPDKEFWVHSTLEPNAVLHVGVPLTEEVLRSPETTYIWGRIMYRDCFRKKHYRNFQFELRGGTGFTRVFNLSKTGNGSS